MKWPAHRRSGDRRRGPGQSGQSRRGPCGRRSPGPAVHTSTALPGGGPSVLNPPFCVARPRSRAYWRAWATSTTTGPDEGTRQLIEQEADEHFGGRWGAAAAAILEAAHAAASAPDDPWAGPTSYQVGRSRRRWAALDLYFLLADLSPVQLERKVDGLNSPGRLPRPPSVRQTEDDLD